ncbi:hypothetical protein JXR93_12385 [bacterium]|nr:hypothetical protein [bacterium]
MTIVIIFILLFTLIEIPVFFMILKKKKNIYTKTEPSLVVEKNSYKQTQYNEESSEEDSNIDNTIVKLSIFQIHDDIFDTSEAFTTDFNGSLDHLLMENSEDSEVLVENSGLEDEEDEEDEDEDNYNEEDENYDPIKIVLFVETEIKKTGIEDFISYLEYEIDDLVSETIDFNQLKNFSSKGMKALKNRVVKQINEANSNSYVYFDLIRDSDSNQLGEYIKLEEEFIFQGNQYSIKIETKSLYKNSNFSKTILLFRVLEWIQSITRYEDELEYILEEATLDSFNDYNYEEFEILSFNISIKTGSKPTNILELIKKYTEKHQVFSDLNNKDSKSLEKNSFHKNSALEISSDNSYKSSILDDNFLTDKNSINNETNLISDLISSDSSETDFDKKMELKIDSFD